jgi:TIR domain
MPNPESMFQYDVFLSHSAKDKAIVRKIAERLGAGGLRVWFDEWALKPGDSIPAKIEEGLEGSRVLVLCMSANAFGSDWAQLESGTFRFRDPLNKERRFIPLRLDDTPIKGSLGQCFYIDWRSADRDREYSTLCEVCGPSANLLGGHSGSERLEPSVAHTEQRKQGDHTRNAIVTYDETT